MLKTHSHFGFAQTMSKLDKNTALHTTELLQDLDLPKPPSMDDLSALNKSSKVRIKRKAYDRLSYNEDKIFKDVEASRQKSMEYLRLTAPVVKSNSGSAKVATMYATDSADWLQETEVVGYRYKDQDIPRLSVDARSTHKSHQSSAASYTSGFYKPKSRSHALANLKFKTSEVSQKANAFAPESMAVAACKTFYKVPYKDFYFQSMATKKASAKQSDFERTMSLKVENTLKAVQEMLAKSSQLQSKPLMKVMLLVVGFTQEKVEGLITQTRTQSMLRSNHGSRAALVTEVHPADVPQLVYLEKTLSTKTIVESYVNVYLRTDQYSFGFSPENNKVLVDRIVRFLKQADQRILLLRCKNHTDLFDRFAELEKYKRKDCTLKQPAVHLLDSSESRLVRYLFLHYSPEMRGFSESSGKIGTIDLDTLGMDSPSKAIASDKFQFPEDSVSQDSDKVVPEPEYRRNNKSKWLLMIEKCLATKEIMKASPEEFEGVFDEFVDKKKLEDYAKSHEFRARDGKANQAITKFRNLLGYQIQEERSGMLQSRGYDD